MTMQTDEPANANADWTACGAGEVALPDPENCKDNVLRGPAFTGTCTTRDYPSENCIHELFELEAATGESAIAVVCGGQHVSLKKLNSRANKWANLLSERGVGPEVLVGMLMEPSVEMITVMLGILKAGGAYLPLDPTSPKE